MLSDAQKKEAEQAYIDARLPACDVGARERISECRDEIRGLQDEIEEQQRVCTHDLMVRETENHGYDNTREGGDESYWTTHVCNNCGLKWTTHQRWQYVGTKLGLPDDQAAKKENE